MRQNHWIEAVYDELGPGLYRHALMILTSAPLAEEAVQQTFVRLLERGRIADIAFARAFLHAVVRHEAYRLLKQARRGDAQPPEDRSLLAQDDPPEQREQRRDLERALLRLPEDQREVVYLKLWQQMTFTQIAELLQVPLNTAASRYRYALEHLRELMPREEV
jgi:RNA polymerase sigma-70 factor (ECF subfamily)